MSSYVCSRRARATIPTRNDGPRRRGAARGRSPTPSSSALRSSRAGSRGFALRSVDGETWALHEPHLSRALDAWIERENPSPERRDALNLWLLRLLECGPPADGTIRSDGDDDLYCTNVESARVVVTYLAVLQDRRIFLRRISGTR